jgi:ribosomal-protein-alanine N-acetyltransferase
MLQGESVRLRTVRAKDLDALIESWGEMRARGRYFPQGVFTETELRRRFQDNGFWSENGGWLMLENGDGRFRDMQRYSLLRSEWEQRAAAPAR